MKTRNQHLSARRSARLATVQALYQQEQTGGDINAIVAEFTEHRFSPLQKDSLYFNPDVPLFQSLVLGVTENLEALDALVEANLAENWKLDRLPSVMRAILRTASFELRFEEIVPTPVIINEYIEISKEFFQDKDISFVNGILDVISRHTRTKPDIHQNE